MDEFSANDQQKWYNQLHLIAHQQRRAEAADFPDTLRAVAEVIHRHGAHLNFGISLIHRHQDLSLDCVMVHSQDLSGRDICKMERRGQRRVFPRAYKYHPDCDEFVPYEYSSIPTLSPDNTLLAEIASLVRSRDLWQLIGVVHIMSHGLPWREENLSTEEGGTIATQLVRGEILSEYDIVTEWVVRESNFGIELAAYKGCTDTEAGHRRT